MRCSDCDGIVKFPTQHSRDTGKCGNCMGVKCRPVRQARRRGPGA